MASSAEVFSTVLLACCVGEFSCMKLNFTVLFWRGGGVGRFSHFLRWEEKPTKKCLHCLPKHISPNTLTTNSN